MNHGNVLPESPFSALRRDPEGLLAFQTARVREASPTLGALLEDLLAPMTQDQRSTMAACLALIERMPRLALMPVEDEAALEPALLAELRQMRPEVAGRYPFLILQKLSAPDEQMTVDLAFSRIHRAIRLYAKAPPR